MSTMFDDIHNYRIACMGMNIVLIANELNLSIFKNLWLCKNGILKEEEITESAIISPAVIEIPTPKFRLTLLPNRLQLFFAEPNDTNVSEPLNRVLGGILGTLPHTPFIAIGINIDFIISTLEPTDYINWNKKWFASNFALNVCANPEVNPCFGSYFSMDIEGMRLKLDIKPSRFLPGIPRPNESFKDITEVMAFNFNYHQDLPSDNPAKQALTTIQRWETIITHARTVMNQL